VYLTPRWTRRRRVILLLATTEWHAAVHTPRTAALLILPSFSRHVCSRCSSNTSWTTMMMSRALFGFHANSVVDLRNLPTRLSSRRWIIISALRRRIEPRFRTGAAVLFCLCGIYTVCVFMRSPSGKDTAIGDRSYRGCRTSAVEQSAGWTSTARGLCEFRRLVLLRLRTLRLFV